MNEKRDDGGPAYPVTTRSEGKESHSHLTLHPGMSLRDWFAGMALSGMFACEASYGNKESQAKCAYEQADAMLAERKK